jgi:hypothetical protein
MTYLRDMMINFQIEKRSFPIYIIPASYLAFAMLFPDRWNYAAGLGLALILFLGSYGLGKRLSYLVFKISDQTMYFPLGLGLTLGVVYLAGVFSTQPLLFYLTWGSLALLAFPEIPILTYRLRRAYLWGVPFVLLGFWSSFTPVTFYDSLVYYLGLPYQYLANGRVSVLPFELYSAFPPLNQVLNLLFIGMHVDGGINAFSIILYLQVIAILVGLLRLVSTDEFSRSRGNGRDQSGYESWEFEKNELLVNPMLMLPAAWILIHILTAEMLVGLFFCSGVALLMKEFDALTLRKLWVVALFLGFSALTKSNVLLYLPFLFILWFVHSRWNFSKEKLQSMGLLFAMILLILAPFFIRNYIKLGDPLYPALSGFLELKNWGRQQSLALQQDIAATENRGILDIFLTPIRLTFAPSNYGSAAPIGLVALISIIVYPFASKRKEINQILLFVFFCYLAWLFVFRDFRQFFAVFLLSGLMTYSSFRQVSRKSQRLLYLCLGLCLVTSLHLLYPIYGFYFPLISPAITRMQYLEKHTDYFTAAELVNKLDTKSKILTLGQTRSAYFTKAMVVPTAFDQNPLFVYLAESRDAEELLMKLQTEKIGYLFCNWDEYRRLVLKCRILPVDLLPPSIGVPLLAQAADQKIKLPLLNAKQKEILKTFLSRYVSLQYQKGNIFLYRIAKNGNT